MLETVKYNFKVLNTVLKVKYGILPLPSHINSVSKLMRFVIIIPNPSVQPKVKNNQDFSNIPKIEYIETSKSTEVGGEGGSKYKLNTHRHTPSSRIRLRFSST